MQEENDLLTRGQLTSVRYHMITHEERGVYVLDHGLEVICVGRTTDRALGTMPASFDAAKLAPALEAILVEALEPRQNRKRGDDLAAVEYVQMEDPEIQERRVKAAIDEALNKA